MIDKNFYLENLSAFDILIQDEREKAEEVIFRVYCILQRDKIWLSEVATEEEITEEDAELLEEVEAELQQMDAEYHFHFDNFYNRMQQEMKKRQGVVKEEVKEKFKDEVKLNEDFDQEEEEDDWENEYDFEVDEEENEDQFSHLSDEELDSVTDYILASAKTRFDYSDFLRKFPETEENFVDDEFILPLIAAKAFGETTPEIAEKIMESFETAGYDIALQELTTMIDQKGKELGLEILAFKIAADSLQQGAHPTAVVDQISQLFKK